MGFESTGTHPLKGFEQPFELFEVAPQTSQTRARET